MHGVYLGREEEGDQLTQLIFSWSLDDILNENLYKYQVEKIPLTFCSVAQYLWSFVYPLLEETRAELASYMKIMHRAPYAEVCSLSEVKLKGNIKMVYEVTVDTWKNRFCERGKATYRTLPGDVLILADWKPESVSDLQRIRRTWAFSLVKSIKDDEDDEDNTKSVRFKVTTSERIKCQDGMFVVFLMNITTNKRIWNSLHRLRNSNIIKEILYSDKVVKENCDKCSFDSDSLYGNFDSNLVSKLNESQREAILASIGKMECSYHSSVEQIWGPPGTGKTTTVSVLLFILLQMKCRTLACAPTNAAVVQVASRVLNLVKKSFKISLKNGDSFYSVGDVLLFGNKERLKVGTDIKEIYLEHRIKKLTHCLGSSTGWKHCLKSMIDLLKNSVSQYHDYVNNEKFKKEKLKNENKNEREDEYFNQKLLKNENENERETSNMEVKSFVEFLQDRFHLSALPLRRCIVTFCTHISRSFLTEETFQNMVSLLDNLCFLESLLFENNLVSDELENLFRFIPLEDDYEKLGGIQSINSVRIMSISIMNAIKKSLKKLRLPHFLNKYAMTDFCFQMASLIFCTTSSSYKLHSVEMKPLNFLVMDEAAQLKGAESTIPLQIHGIRHAILVGDERQLPALVTSNVSAKSGFGRSLFDRLTSLGHSKHLLNVQYRMHPSISSSQMGSFIKIKF